MNEPVFLRTISRDAEQRGNTNHFVSISGKKQSKLRGRGQGLGQPRKDMWVVGLPRPLAGSAAAAQRRAAGSSGAPAGHAPARGASLSQHAGPLALGSSEQGWRQLGYRGPTHPLRPAARRAPRSNVPDRARKLGAAAREGRRPGAGGTARVPGGRPALSRVGVAQINNLISQSKKRKRKGNSAQMVTVFKTTLCLEYQTCLSPMSHR